MISMFSSSCRHGSNFISSSVPPFLLFNPMILLSFRLRKASISKDEELKTANGTLTKRYLMTDGIWTKAALS
jgi:hypothetical protein